MRHIALYEDQYASNSLPFMVMKHYVRTKIPLNGAWIGEYVAMIEWYTDSV